MTSILLHRTHTRTLSAAIWEKKNNNSATNSCSDWAQTFCSGCSPHPQTYTLLSDSFSHTGRTLFHKRRTQQKMLLYERQGGVRNSKTATTSQCCRSCRDTSGALSEQSLNTGLLPHERDLLSKEQSCLVLVSAGRQHWWWRRGNNSEHRQQHSISGGCFIKQKV